MAAYNFHGFVAPVFTPLDDDGTIKYEVIPKYVKYLAKHNITGILVGGTTSEFASFNTNERNELLDAWLKAARPLNLKIMVQVGGAPLPDVIKMAQYADNCNVDAIITLPELYFRPKTAEQLVSYLEVINKAAPRLPILYYHFPMMTGVNVNVSEFFSLASSRLLNFKGIKADLGDASQLVDQLSEDQLIYIANHMLGPSALMGHDSSIATVNNIFPSLVNDIVKLTKHGYVEKAKKLQEMLNSLVHGITSHGDFVPCMKAAMELVTGINVGPPRMPQKPLRNAQIEQIKELLKTHSY